MHELSVTQGILGVAVDAARQAGVRRIVAIDLAVGELSSIVDDSVQFYFDLLSRGTPAEGAALRFRRVPASCVCRGCGARQAVVVPLPEVCPACGGAQLQIVGGRELSVESIEVTDEDRGRAGDLERERSGGG